MRSRHCCAIAAVLAFFPALTSGQTPTRRESAPVPEKATTPDKWESLLERVDIERNAVQGQWRKTDGGLRVQVGPAEQGACSLSVGEDAP